MYGTGLMSMPARVLSISPAMQDQPRYDPLKSFSHVVYIGSVANVFVVHPSVPAKNIKELVALAQEMTALQTRVAGLRRCPPPLVPVVCAGRGGGAGGV